MFAQPKNKPMTIADLIQSAIDSSKERIKTPITGAFICSFLIYNWDTILILLFSKSSIEVRIGLAKKSFDYVSFLWPIAMALLLTICIPFLMWALDSINIFAKKKRLGKSFQNKRNLILEKIKIQVDLNDLKNAESGNKEKQDFINQINVLEQSKLQLEESTKQIHTANKISVDQLNSKLKEANESYENLMANIPEEYRRVDPLELRNVLLHQKELGKERNEIEFKAMMEGIFIDWQLDQLFSLLDLYTNADDILDISSIDPDFFRKLRNLELFITTNEGDYKITDHGRDFIEFVKRKNSTTYDRFKFQNNLT